MIFECEKDQAHYDRALKRFVAKCKYDEKTGCVLWTGAAHHYRAGIPQYGGFHYEGRKVLAHRWAAVNIHGLNLDGGLTVGHTCPHGPNVMCVQHLEPQTYLENNREMVYRRELARARMNANEKQYWMLVEKGIEREPDRQCIGPLGGYPDPPEWYRLAKERFNL